MSPSLPPLIALRAFEAAARLGSMARAAEELHVTHGAISRHVRSLEQNLGSALFNKAGRGLVLTEAGERLRDAAGEAFARIGDTWQNLRQLPAHAPLVLGAPGSLLARWLIPRLAELEHDLPQLRLHLSAHELPPSADLPGLDATILLAAPPWPAQWQVQELAPERVGAVLSPQHPLATELSGQPPARLLQESLLHTRSRPQAWPDWARGHGLDPAQLRTGIEFEHLIYLLEAAVAGLGVAIAPEPLVAADLASGRLIAPWGFVETPARWVLCSQRHNPDPRIAQLADWCRSKLAG